MFTKLCRLCCENEGIIPIFNNTDESSLSKKILYCCNKAKINIEADDDLPKSICNTCNDFLCKSYDFILKCEFADEKLRLLLSETNNYCDHEVFEQCSNISDELKLDLKNDPDTIFKNKECIRHDDEMLISSEIDKQKDFKDLMIRKKTKQESKIKQKAANTSQSNFKCSICGKVCINNSTLLAHMRSHSDKRAFQCSHCDKTYKDPSGLKRHIETNHTDGRSRKFICDSCGKSFFTKKCLQVHSRTHTGETPYACKFCPAQFSQSSSFIRHQRRHTGEKPYQCNLCKKSFCSKTELTVHFKVHSQDKHYSCVVCNVQFKHKSTFNMHMSKHANKTVFICDLCGQNFNAKSNLALHIGRRHSVESGYCDICSKYASNIKKHMWKHNGYRGLKCDYCSSAFFNKLGLIRHMSYKHNNSTYKCVEGSCEAEFPAKRMLEYHMTKVHSSVVPFPCDRCSRGFYRKSDYVRHKLGTHKEPECVNV